jgi:serine/threonine-protein kinase
MIDDRLGKWSIYSQLGRGGMGQVFLAQEEMSGRLAAIKVLTPELAQDPGFRQRFQQEIEALSKLDHPNIVRLYESGFENGLHFYAMEYVEGESLEQLLSREKRLPWEQVLEIALQVGPALKHAHDHGIVHRDLKPGNLLRAAGGVVKLSDFGIAKVFAGGHLTATGGIVGTAEYISPEQAEGKPATNKSDLYSLGIVLYLLLTGKTPFEGKGPLELLHKHRYAQFDPPQNFVEEIPYELNDIVCRLLEKDPDKRPPDAMVLTKELRKVRKRLERKSTATELWEPAELTVAEGRAELDPERREGPATLMSRLMRQELDRQQKGGSLTRFINQPVVLIVGLVLCVAVLVYALWPVSNETLYQRGAELMASDSISDWKKAFEDYFDPLEKRDPDHPYKKEVAEFRKRLDAALRGDEAPPGEAERFFRLGERQRQDGDFTGARRTWQNLVRAFGYVPQERTWVDQARRQLEELAKQETDARRWQSVRAAMKKAAELNRRDKRDEAEQIWQGIEQLYANDPAAAPILAEIRKARGGK